MSDNGWTVLTSDTTNRNTSRFLLLSGLAYGEGYVNLQPAVRSVGASGRGAGFVVTVLDPIQLLSSGESRI